MSDQAKLEILIDVRSRLEDLVKSQQEFRKLREEASSFGNMLKTGVGIDVARRGLDLLKGSLRESVFESFRLADSIKDNAQNLGISTTAYQVLGNVLKDAGGDASLLTMAISQSNRSLVEARTLGTGAAGAYRQLGLDVATLNAMPVEQRFEAIGRAVARSTDRTAAFSAASQILGARNLPTLLGALKDLAEGGYGNLEAAMVSAGRVMQDETIARLDAAGKSIEKFKQATTIFVGENIGGAMGTWDALVAGWATNKTGLMKAAGESALQAFLTPWKLFGIGGDTALLKYLVKNAPAAPTSSGPVSGDGSAASSMALTNAKAQAEYNLAAAILARQTLESDQNKTDGQKRQQTMLQIEGEIALRRVLISLTSQTPLGSTETQDQRDLKIAGMQEKNIQLGNELIYLQQMSRVDNTLTDFFAPLDKRTKAKDSEFNFNTFNNPNSNSDFLTLGQGVKSGAQDWVSSLGSQGQQVAQSLQSTLGSTVTGISDGIMGWVEGTRSFGSSMLQLGGTIFRTFLDTIIQMGVQWLVTQALIKTGMISTHVVGETLRASRTAGAVAEGSATTAAMAPAAAAASISSFGAAAILGIVALVAAMAIFGGFAGGGYTGDAPTNAVAGVVHGQEHVMTASTTRRLGPAFFDHLNAGGSPATAVAGSSMAFGGEGASGGGARESARNTYLLMDRESFSRAMQEDSTGYFREIAAGMMRA